MSSHDHRHLAPETQRQLWLDLIRRGAASGGRAPRLSWEQMALAVVLAGLLGHLLARI
jgi:hypothetical protein